MSQAEQTTSPDIPLPDMLRQMLARIDSYVAAMPDSRLEAKRQLEGDFRFEPTATQLHLITSLTDAPANSEAIGRISRSTLALLILVEHELQQVFTCATLDNVRLELATRRLPSISRIVDRLEADLDIRISKLEGREKEFLAQVRNTLLPDRDRLNAAMVLAPRLLQFTVQHSGGSENASFSALTDDEIRVLDKAMAGTAGPMDAALRCSVNSIALRTVIADDLQSWKQSWENLEDDESYSQAREIILDNLKQDVVAYQAVSARLQDLQSDSVAGGNKASLEDLSRAKKDLFSIYRDLSSAVRNPDGPPEETAKVPTEEELQRLREECSAAEEAAAEHRSDEVSEEEIYLAALKKEQMSEEEPDIEPEVADLKKERVRIRVLSAIAAVLLIAVAAVYGTMLGQKPQDIRVPVSEMSNDLSVISAMTIGPMMYVQVSSVAWKRLGEADRLSGVADLGRSAAERGLETIYVTDEKDRDLALWTTVDGPRLAE